MPCGTLGLANQDGSPSACPTLTCVRLLAAHDVMPESAKRSRWRRAELDLTHNALLEVAGSHGVEPSPLRRVTPVFEAGSRPHSRDCPLLLVPVRGFEPPLTCS